MSRFEQCKSREDMLLLFWNLWNKTNFLQIFEWLKISRGKTNKSYDTSAAQNDPGYNTKKSVNLILKNGMLIYIYTYIYIYIYKTHMLRKNGTPIHLYACAITATTYWEGLLRWTLRICILLYMQGKRVKRAGQQLSKMP